MERYHIFKLGLAILFYAAYCIRPMLVNGLRSMNKTELRPEDYLVFYQIEDGLPGVDFPILSNIPRTTFSCENIDSGYYADLDTDCQVFHICEEGRKISFLCPNGTIFDQSDLICEWWFKVDCSNSPNLYHESAELLREDLARRKASRKVYLNGQERNHGAVMRVEESSSTSARTGNKNFRAGTPNAITSNGNTRASHGGPDKIPQSSPPRAIGRPGGQLDIQKPKRYNDADTGNYVNKVDTGSNLKEYHVQLSGNNPRLDTASSEKHVQVQPTTPSTLNSVTSGQGPNLFKTQVSGSRGNIKFRPSLENEEEGTPTAQSSDEYDLQFPKHRSQISKDKVSGSRTASSARRDKVDGGVQAALRGRPSSGLSSVGGRTSDSDELQVPQETAAFAKNSYNSLHPTSRKQSTINPYPNHRATYSDLKQPTFATPKFLGSINSVTPQYITTQPINNGKPFVGSTVGINVYGAKLRTSTSIPETSPFGRHISSTFTPIAPTTQIPFAETSTSDREIVSPSRFSGSSTTKSPTLERNTKRPLDQATVYGTFSKSDSSTPSTLGNQFGNNENKIDFQGSVAETPTYGSAVQPPLLTPDAVVHINDLQSTPGTIPSYSTVRSDTSTDLNAPGDSDTLIKFGSTRTTTSPTLKTYYSSTTVDNSIGTTESTIPNYSTVRSDTSTDFNVPGGSGTLVTFGGVKAKESPTPKTYHSSTTVDNNQGTTEPGYHISTTTKSNTFDKTIQPTFKTYYPSTTVNDIQSTTEPGYTSTVKTDTFETNNQPTLKTYYPTTVNDIQDTTESSYGRATSPSSKFSTTAKNVVSYPTTTGRNLGFAEGSTLPSRTIANSGTDSQSPIEPQINSEGGSGVLLTPKFSDLTVKSSGTGTFVSTTTKPVDVSQSGVEGTQRPDLFVTDDLGKKNYVTPPVSNGGSAIPASGTVSISSSNRNVPILSSASLGKTSVPSSEGVAYKASTERTGVLIGQSVTMTAEPFTLRGRPFESSSLSSDVGVQLSGSQEGSRTIEPTLYKAVQGRPFKTSEETSTPRTQLSTGRPIETTGQPSINVITHRGRPFKSSQYSNTSPEPTTDGGEIYEDSTDRIQLSTGQSIGTTVQLPISTVSSRGRPLKGSEEATVGGFIQEVFTTESGAFTTGVPSGTTIQPSFNAATLRGQPFKATDSAVGGTEYEGSTEYPQISTKMVPDGAGVEISIKASQGRRPFGSKQQSGNVVEPSPTPIVSGFSAKSTTLPSNQLLEQGTTLAPTIQDIPKYDSAVLPPLLNPDAFVRISSHQSTFRPIQAVNRTKTDGNNNLDSKITPTYFGSSTAAPLIGTTHSYGSTVPSPLATKDLSVHVNDVQSTLRPTNEANGKPAGKDNEIFGKKIKSSISTGSSTPLPNLKSFIQGISQNAVGEIPKYGGFDVDNNRQIGHYGGDSKTAPEYSIGNNLPSSDVESSRAEPAAHLPLPTLKSPNSISLTVSSHGGKEPEGPGFFVTKNGYASSTPYPLSTTAVNYEQSTPVVNVNQYSGEGGIQPPQSTLSAPKIESSFEKEVPLTKSESQWPRPFQRPNSLDSNKERATYLPTTFESTTSPYVTYQISSARPFMLPEGTPGPTVPSPFKPATTSQNSVYENVDNMINMLKEIVNATDQDFSSETPRPGLVVPPSAGPQTLHTLAVYFANALDGIAAEREKLTGEELDEESKEKLTNLLTQMTMYRYKELFKGREEPESEVTTVAMDLEDDSENLIEAPGLRQLARNFSLALSSYLDNPEAFRKDLESLRPTEPPQLSEDATEGGANDEELLNFSDSDAKPNFPPAFPTSPAVTPTWGYIIAPGGPNDLDVKNSLNPDLHASDTQSFVPGFNNLPAGDSKGSSKDNQKGLPENHWTDSPGATKLLQSAFSVNPAVVNEHFVTTEPTLSDGESTDSYIASPSDLPRLDLPQTEVRYDLRSLPKVSVNTTEVRGLLIDFINTTKSDESNRLQRLLKKLNTTENEFLSRMKEIDSNPLTKRLILLLISECGTNATKDIAEQAERDLSEETLESSQSASAVASYTAGRHSSDIPELVDSNLQDDDQDTRALQLLNSLYTIAAKFGK